VGSYSTGDRVVQASYGTGTITASNERHTIIDFDEHGIRTFSTMIVRLERTSVPAPGRPAKRKSTRKPKVAKATPAIS